MRARVSVLLCCVLGAAAMGAASPPAAAVGAQPLQYARLGDFRLESGAVIHDCRIGFRTFGTLNADRSNAVLFLTYFGGTSEQLAPFIPWLGLDKYYVIAVDALGNGVSSSPSNSLRQPRMRFPQFTVGDMVATEHLVLVQHLGITHVKAVMGISMGGIQTFQWMVTYPDFMDDAIPMLGSPRLAPYSLLHLRLGMDLIMESAAWKGGNYDARDPPAALASTELADLLLSTPQYVDTHSDRGQLFRRVAASGSIVGHDANDKIRQTQALLRHDVAAAFGGSMSDAAAAVHAKALIVVSQSDHVVTPGPALEFAQLMNARTLVLNDACGHNAIACELAKVAGAIHDLLD